ncbi:CGH_1_HP_G0064590.mRNA.1.CDS.1 [Saccharomyces cerevisiae]|nr:CGH_1_HP_G0064590.mRNA.1.CDS.1 [Saccharomyces cerevisiae]CAI6851323.1 CGH_1_HP_G0064590.mRNA.1.CDS.1 [Saccharomyces cerevisiae]
MVLLLLTNSLLQRKFLDIIESLIGSLKLQPELACLLLKQFQCLDCNQITLSIISMTSGLGS